MAKEEAVRPRKGVARESERVVSGPYDGPNVYTLMDAKGYPLYVGVTGNDMRLVKHSSDKPWWNEVRSFHIQKYDSIEEARVAEIDAIHNLNPRYNKIHKPRLYLDLDHGWYHFCPAPTCEWSSIPEETDEMAQWEADTRRVEAYEEASLRGAKSPLQERRSQWERFLEWEKEQTA